jgi:hypothetical protein
MPCRGQWVINDWLKLGFLVRSSERKIAGLAVALFTPVARLRLEG